MTRDEFLKVLGDSNLLSPEQFDAARNESDDDADPRATVRRVVQRGWLTQWQAQQLLAGRSKLFLGKYKLLQSLGQGGMGAVFKAEQPSLKRVVAIKVMARHVLQNKDAVSRFLREIRTVAALDHPHIVAAYDADCAGQTYFLVMEYVPGIDLKHWIVQQGRLPIGWSCEVIRQAALGLQHAHEHGLVHRDIKPANLLIVKPSEDRAAPASGGVPKVKILDLGLARFASDSHSDGSLTNTGQIMGTPDYIAPEQAENTKRADVRADIYSLGCTLFEMLTGSVPFEGETAMQKVLARINGTAPRLKSLRPDAPAQLDELVARMLARDPAQRQQTPAEVARQLEPFALSTSPQSTQQTMLLEPETPLSRPPASTDASVEEKPDTTLNGFLNALASKAAATPPATTIQTRATAAPRSNVLRNRREPTIRARLWTALAVVGVLGLFAAGWWGTRGTPAPVSQRGPNGTGGTTPVVGPGKSSPASTAGDSPDFIDMLTSPDWTWTTPENLGRHINSTGPDRSPTVTADGQILVFSSHRAGNYDLFECVRKSADEPFGPATPLATVNSPDPDETPFLTPDGLTLLFSSRRSGSGDDIYVSRRTRREEPWRPPERLGDAVNSKQVDIGPQLSPDGLSLVFHSSRREGYGRSDLWMSRRASPDASWGQAINLGPEINGAEDDRYPQFTPDGKSLFFVCGDSRNEDVRFARPGRDGRWRQIPLQLPSAGMLRMSCLSPDGRTAYVTASMSGSVGDFDLWRMRRVKKSASERAAPAQSAIDRFVATRAGAEWDGNALKMKFCWCPDGSFTMGSPSNEADRNSDEDQVSVALTGFWLGKFEVTQAEWTSVMATSLTEQAEKGTHAKTLVGKGPRQPMYYVNRDEAAEFSRKLTEQESAAGRLPFGWEYRLPTEAQWEYGCRAGTTTRFVSGDTEEGLSHYGWVSATAGGATHDVGTKQANAWGLHDMHGNLWEWCRDSYANPLPGGKDPEPSERASFGVCRGGSWHRESPHARSATRFKTTADYRGNSVGFRVVAVRVTAGGKLPSPAVAPFGAGRP